MQDSDLEILWEQLLSRQPEHVLAAFSGLAAQEKQSVLAHLRSMASEPGWHPEQRLSAQSALDAIQPIFESTSDSSTP
jgi:hypothetical protein